MVFFFGIKYTSFRNIWSGIRKKNFMFFFGILFFGIKNCFVFGIQNCFLFGILFFGIHTAFFSEYFFWEYRLRSFRNICPRNKKLQGCTLFSEYLAYNNWFVPRYSSLSTLRWWNMGKLLLIGRSQILSISSDDMDIPLCQVASENPTWWYLTWRSQL